MHDLFARLPRSFISGHCPQMRKKVGGNELQSKSEANDEANDEATEGGGFSLYLCIWRDSQFLTPPFGRLGECCQKVLALVWAL